MAHKAGFVNIIGNPNVGKSTLMNKLVGEKLSIITSKAQTTRHRILGIVNGEDFQIVFSDTPGIVRPAYKLHDNMMKSVNTAAEDADLILLMTDIYEKEFNEEELVKTIVSSDIPVMVILNKMDQCDPDELKEKAEYWKERLGADELFAISALHGINVLEILELIKEKLPESPEYYPKDQLTDRPEKFFVSEIIREKILKNYKKEIPYACQVEVESFKEEEKLIRIRAEIYVERESQKGIVIGHQGQGLKKVGTESRKDIENFLDKKVFLELFVKVKKDWRNEDGVLKNFGY